MVAAEYYVEQWIHIIISVVIFGLYLIETLVDRRVTYLEKGGQTAVHVGKVQYGFHRVGLICATLMIVKSVDPVIAFRVYNEKFLSWINFFIASLLLIILFMMVFWTLESAYMSLGLTQRIPNSVKIFFATFASILFLIANFHIVGRAYSNNMAATEGTTLFVFALFEFTCASLLTIAVFKLRGVVRSSTLSASNKKVTRALNRLYRWVLSVWVCCGLCIILQMVTFADQVADPTKPWKDVDQDSYEFSSFNSFWIAEYLGLCIGLWFSWMPPSWIYANGTELYEQKAEESTEASSHHPVSPRGNHSHKRILTTNISSSATALNQPSSDTTSSTSVDHVELPEQTSQV